MKKQNQKQHSFFKTHSRSHKKFFGGALLAGKRKSLRPLSCKDSIHFVLRSRWAMGKDSFLSARNHKAVSSIIATFAKKFGVRVYERAINTNHIHLLLKITNRILYRAFIKAVSGKIASHVMGEQSFADFSRARTQSRASHKLNLHCSRKRPAKISKKGDGVPTSEEGDKQALEKHQGFWEFRPFSRIVNWGRDFKTCVDYLKQNVLEALGFAPYKKRKNYYSAWLRDSTPDLNNKNTS